MHPQAKCAVALEKKQATLPRGNSAPQKDEKMEAQLSVASDKRSEASLTWAG